MVTQHQLMTADVQHWLTHIDYLIIRGQLLLTRALSRPSEGCDWTSSDEADDDEEDLHNEVNEDIPESNANNDALGSDRQRYRRVIDVEDSDGGGKAGNEFWPSGLPGPTQAWGDEPTIQATVPLTPTQPMQNEHPEADDNVLEHRMQMTAGEDAWVCEIELGECHTPPRVQ
jgi:hypothetical protein